MPPDFIAAVALIKAAAARANARLGLLPADIAAAIADAALDDRAAATMPTSSRVDVFQTGSGTSTNMNVERGDRAPREPRARQARASERSRQHVPEQQRRDSERDPPERAARKRGDGCIRRSNACATCCAQKEREWAGVLKTGRTHLMDAMPMTLGQEASGWRAQIDNAIERLEASEPRLLALAQGGTAIGTGINAHEKFAATFIEELRGAHPARSRRWRQTTSPPWVRRTPRSSSRASCARSRWRS